MVSRAVQAAHQRTIVHRDLKPSNILVTRDGVPKLLDFGIAKTLQGEPSDQTFSTAPGMRMMTPRYASPEQIEGYAADVRMDVYSLGVILYELITGAHPQRVDDLSISEAMQRICNDEPIPPSSVACETANLMPKDRELRRDLDNILLKALHKDPNRRYGSAEQLAQISNDIWKGSLYPPGRILTSTRSISSFGGTALWLQGPSLSLCC